MSHTNQIDAFAHRFAVDALEYLFDTGSVDSETLNTLRTANARVNLPEPDFSGSIALSELLDKEIMALQQQVSAMGAQFDQMVDQVTGSVVRGVKMPRFAASDPALAELTAKFAADVEAAMKKLEG